MTQPPPPHIPRHVAIIMDGNGRWASLRRLPRTAGHREGAKRVDDIVSHCRELGVGYLTLFAFSTENWNRPLSEVNTLMRLLVRQLGTMDKKLIRNEVSLHAQGTLERLPGFVRKELDRVIRVTSTYPSKMQLTLCLSYGGRQEIVDAAKAIAREAAAGRLDPESVDEAAFASRLYRPEVPDPDLLIRTGGEYRISNFLLWEAAYAEIYVSNALWPDFHPADLDEAFAAYSRRERRFGLTSEQAKNLVKPFSGLEPATP